MKKVIALIEWKDTKDVEEVVISLTTDRVEGSEEDNRTFFYCNGLEELEQLTRENNGEDFVVVSYLT